ncbi:hypothetical protein [Epilithonimonas zeae]|uniref:hypothetical protein n=1 Tax=Epilithonimonas zeae TaxID=1416779 RepID=UPI00201056D7|nr:hypothetical protein [Epilithonimonas zeae]UQB68103.1 hypothetical protein KI430_13845 [Epilithonimonas zeae]
MFERKKELTKIQKEKKIDAQKNIILKKFKEWYIVNYGTGNYNSWKLSIEKRYPEFK